MAKTTRLGWGAAGTNALDESYLNQVSEGEPTKLEEDEVGEESSPGISSEKSTGKPGSEQKKNGPAAVKPAKTTGRRSKKTAQVSSTAGSADEPTEADDDA